MASRFCCIARLLRSVYRIFGIRSSDSSLTWLIWRCWRFRTYSLRFPSTFCCKLSLVPVALRERSVAFSDRRWASSWWNIPIVDVAFNLCIWHALRLSRTMPIHSSAGGRSFIIDKKNYFNVFEKHLSCEHFVEDKTASPNVALLCISFLLRSQVNLGACINWGTLLACYHYIFSLSCQSKVADLQILLNSDQNVIRLQISVHFVFNNKTCTFGIHIAHTFDHLSEIFQRL